MVQAHRDILIVADIEGSSGCWSHQASAWRTDAWAQACLAMTLDVNHVVENLFDCGVRSITIKDFHRSGYNLLPEGIHPRARLEQGFRRQPVPGIGNPGQATAVMFLGMHAASGTGGFLAHTLTSRIERLEVNGRLLSEVELFAGSLAPFDIPAIFFSGCPVACRQAQEALPGIDTYAIDKSAGSRDFDALSWRKGLAGAAAGAIANTESRPFRPPGPFKVAVTMRDGPEVAAELARRWGFARTGRRIVFESPTMQALYMDLIRLCYLSPRIEAWLPFCLAVYNFWGRASLSWVRRRLRSRRKPPEKIY
jgi:D-amino peptidase